MSLYSDLTCTAAYLHSSVSTFLHIIALDTKYIRQLMQFTCEASMDDAIIQTSSIVCLLVRPYLTTCAYTMVVYCTYGTISEKNRIVSLYAPCE